MKRALLIYLLITVVFGFGISVLLHLGKDLPSSGSRDAQVSTASATGASSLRPDSDGADQRWPSFIQHLDEPLARLLLQFIIIVLATRTLGWLFARVHQPSVVGETVAGILLGPSLLGWLWPEAFSLIFATDSLQVLQLISQVGVCVFMFVVGMELDVSQLRGKAHLAVMVSHASIMAPYLLGVASALVLYPTFSAPGTSFLSFALFMGIAMSITAFPVLVRILNERGIAQTALGATAITCAAVDDATAWAILAFVVAVVHAEDLMPALLNLGLVLMFVAAMLWGVRPRLPGWLGIDSLRGAPGRGVLAAVLVVMTTSSLITEVMGLHAIFGAFLAGLVMPAKVEFREYLTVRLENFSSIFLLPLFFAFSGLRTQVGLLNDLPSWLTCLGLILVATAGKLGGSMMAARFTGMAWRDAFALGALMNTRGLVELVALNIGYELGILPPRIFSMMVIMAMITTLMTGPLLNLSERRAHLRAARSVSAVRPSSS